MPSLPPTTTLRTRPSERTASEGQSNHDEYLQQGLQGGLKHRSPPAPASLRPKGLLSKFRYGYCRRRDPRETLIRSLLPSLQVAKSRNTNRVHEIQHTLIIQAHLIHPVTIIRQHKAPSPSQKHLRPSQSDSQSAPSIPRPDTGKNPLTLQTSACGYGSANPFLKAAEFNSTSPPYPATKSKFRTTFPHTRSQRRKLPSGSALFSRTRSKWPTTGGRSARSMAYCASK